jgi:hypothetical protein
LVLPEKRFPSARALRSAASLLRIATPNNNLHKQQQQLQATGIKTALFDKARLVLETEEHVKTCFCFGAAIKGAAL